MRRRLFEEELKLLVEETLSQTIGVSRSERRRIICSIAWGKCSERLLYRLTEERRTLASSRERRADAGTRKRIVPHLDEMVRWTVEQDLTARQVIERAELNNFIEPAHMTPADYNRILRESGISRTRLNADVEPASMIEATVPNQVWQFDPTKLEQLCFDPKRGTIRLDQRWYYDPATKKVRRAPRASRRHFPGGPPLDVWLYALIDDYSRVKFADIFIGKHIDNHLNFWEHAILPKANPHEFPFRGIPRHLYQDNDSSNLHAKMKIVYEALGIHVIPTDPSHDRPNSARKRGKIENGMKRYNDWAKIFYERELSFDEGRAALWDYLVSYNNRPHSTTGEVPFARWSELIQPAEVPSAELFKLFYDDKRRCHVDRHLVIKIDNRWYFVDPQLPDPQNPESPQSFVVDWVDQKVDAYMKPGTHTGKIDVYRGGRHAVAREVKRSDLVRPYFVHGEPFPQTAVEQARQRLTGTYDGPPLKLYPSDPTPPAGSSAGEVVVDQKRPAYLIRGGEAFDESRLERKGPEEEIPAAPPAFIKEIEPKRPLLSTVKVKFLLKSELGFFSGDGDTAEQIAWVDRLMVGRKTIEEDEFLEAVKKAKAEIEGES